MKKHLLFVPILASLVLVGCGEQPTPPGPTPDPVVVNPTGITLSASSLSLIEGESETITATVSPDDAADKTVTWSVTQGSDYVTVNGGIITAVKAGQAVVTAQTVNNLSTSCLVNVTPGIVDPTSVMIDKTNPVIVVGDEVQLNATVLPENATNKSVEWSVIAGNCVSVNETGLVTGWSTGSAVIQAKTINGFVAVSNIKVVSGVVNPTSVALSDSQVNLVNGDTKQLSAYVLPNDATVKSVTWTVSDGDAVTVNETGLVTAVKPGDAVVTASTVNGLTATCSFTVTAAVVDPTGVTLNKHSVDLEFGSSETLTATVDPSDATDKSVTWSVIEGDAVTVVNGLVTGVKQGSAKVQVSTINGKTDVCDFTVGARHIKGYVNKDVHSLIVGNPYEKIGEGDFVEVTDKTTEGGIPCYNFTYGATVKFNVHTDGYYEPTAIKVNNDSYSVVDNAVTFVAEVEDPDDPIFNILDIEVVFRDNTPLIGDYEIVTTESTHISLVYTYDVNGQETKACSRGDKIIVTPVSTNPDYEVKTIKGYSYLNYDEPRHKTSFSISKNDDGTFYFLAPHCCDEDLKVYIEVEEINVTAFKDHEALGEYVVVRTFGTPSNSNISSFQDGFTISFDASGLISYKTVSSEKASYEAYAFGTEEGILHAMFGTSSIDAIYGKNLIILGMNSSGGSMITPLSAGADVAIGVKLADGMMISNISIDNHVVKIDNKSYATFTFYYNDEIYASCFMDIDAKSIITDVCVNKYLREKLSDLKAVYEVFDSKGNSLIHVGYQNEGGEGEYRFITTRTNGYVDINHSLVFINDDQAVFDGEPYKVLDVDTNKITLSIPTHEFDITLDPSSLTFTVTGDREITPKTLDIAGKRFIATIYNSWDEKYCDCEVVFDGSNTNISGVIRFDLKAQNIFYWTFTAEFDSTTDILTITVTDRGYNGNTSNFDNSIGKTARILIEDGQITFKDQVSTQTNVYDFKNKTFTCDDFHF